jgi:hypothetical protein
MFSSEFGYWLELINKSVVIKSFPTVRDNPDGTIRNTDFQRLIFSSQKRADPS